MELMECARFLRTHDRYLVVTHRRPDGDTLGCAGALCHALRRLGKTAWIFPNEESTETYLPYIEKFFAPADFEPETRVTVDVAERSMLFGRADHNHFIHHMDGGGVCLVGREGKGKEEKKLEMLTKELGYGGGA